MIRQQVVISPDVISAIKENSQIFDMKTYWSNFKYKSIVFDSGMIIADEIKNIIDGPDKELKILVNDSILNAILDESKCKIFEINSDSADILAENKLDNLLLTITLKTDSKILNAQNDKLYAICKENSELECLECVDINNFCNPPVNSKIFSNSRKFNLYKNETFRIDEILEHYFYSTDSLTIIDKYILDKRNAYNVLKAILNKCKNLKEIQLWTNFNHIDQKTKKRNKYFASLEELNKDLSDYKKEKNNDIKFNIYESLWDDHLREIYTDTHIITLDKGLNFFKVDKELNFLKVDFRVSSNKTNITIDERNNKSDVKLSKRKRKPLFQIN